MRRAVPVLLGVAVIAILVVGLLQASDGPKDDALPKYDIAQGLKDLDGAPAQLAALHTEHSRLLTGGTKAFRSRVRALRGFPIVVNKWGSWCYPCRQEFPIFQKVSTDYGRRVAFLGVDGKDALDEAQDFMREFPIPFPSYRDKDEDIARAYEIPANYPITLFIGADGKVAFRHQGQYKTLAALKDDIKRYLRV